MDFNFQLIATTSPEKSEISLIPTIRIESELEVTTGGPVVIETNVLRISLVLFILQLQFEFITQDEY